MGINYNIFILLFLLYIIFTYFINYFLWRKKYLTFKKVIVKK